GAGAGRVGGAAVPGPLQRGPPRAARPAVPDGVAAGGPAGGAGGARPPPAVGRPAAHGGGGERRRGGGVPGRLAGLQPGREGGRGAGGGVPGAGGVRLLADQQAIRKLRAAVPGGGAGGGGGGVPVRGGPDVRGGR